MEALSHKSKEHKSNHRHEDYAESMTTKQFWGLDFGVNLRGFRLVVLKFKGVPTFNIAFFSFFFSFKKFE